MSYQRIERGGDATFYLGDCLDVLASLQKNTVHSIVTDPPYGLSFMGQAWDHSVPSVEVWRECLRVLKPGGHLLAFAGTRTQHRMAVAIEDAGFEIRDMIAWVYGSGFPKSLDVSKAIDKSAGAKREVLGRERRDCGSKSKHAFEQSREVEFDITAPATKAARQWNGWGTALKPSLEPITMARKPLAATVAANVQAHRTGALNIDGCRVAGDATVRTGSASGGIWNKSTGKPAGTTPEQGRWPANLIHDGSDEVVEKFPETSICGGAKKTTHDRGMFGIGTPGHIYSSGDGDNQSAARFFYCAKASKDNRGDGNGHPTVKPTDLMSYLVRLVTPPGGTVLDPFAGSGSTLVACAELGFDSIGIEIDEQYFETARKRITAACAQGRLFK